MGTIKPLTSLQNAILVFSVQGAITANATSYLLPGGGVAAQSANELKITVPRAGILRNLYISQRVASGTAGITDVYTVRINGIDKTITCTLDNATTGSDTTHHEAVSIADLVSISLVSNDASDASADVVATLEYVVS